MQHYLHLYESASTFQADYDGEGYHEPWVSRTREDGKVVYNKGPYYGEGFVFDGASWKTAPEGSPVFNDGEITLKMLHHPDDVITPDDNFFGRQFASDGYVYTFDSDHSNLPLPMTVKIVNAKSLPDSPFDEDEVEIELGYSKSWSCAGQWSNNPIGDNPTYPYYFDFFENYCYEEVRDGIIYRPMFLIYEAPQN